MCSTGVHRSYEVQGYLTHKKYRGTSLIKNLCAGVEVGVQEGFHGGAEVAGAVPIVVPGGRGPMVVLFLMSELPLCV